MFSGNKVTCFEIFIDCMWRVRCCYHDIIPNYWHLVWHPGRNRYDSEPTRC